MSPSVFLLRCQRLMSQKGLTLLELLVIWLIVAVGMTLLFPSIVTWSQDYRLRSATKEIVSILNIAQSQAVSKSVEYRVCFDPKTGSYLIQRHSEGGWCQEGRVQVLPTGIRIKDITLPDNCAQFNSNSTYSFGWITHRNPKGKEKRIILNMGSGRIRTE